MTLRRLPRSGIGASLRVLAAVAASSFTLTASAGIASAAPASVSLLTQASPSGVPTGALIFDSVDIHANGSPTGTLTFSAFGPTDPTCVGTPLKVLTLAVHGTGYHQSDNIVAEHAGNYRWALTYSGDANFNPGSVPCTDPSQVTGVGRKNTTLSATAGAPTPSGTISDTATLGQGAGTGGPTGTITFTVYGPGNLTCAPPALATSTRTVTANGTYTSDPFTPSVTGSYVWMAQYSGDTDNFGGATTCSDPAQAVNVTAVASRHTAGDFNGDGKADPSVFRSSTGMWYEGGTATAAVAWGQSGDIAVPGNYDGTGGTKPAVFRPSTGTWYMAGGSSTSWGQSGDIPVPGDYDGDGRTDMAVFRPSNGTWYVKGGQTSTYGVSGDIPVPGDYNGDGRTDIAVFRPSTNTWYIAGQGAVSFGLAGDIPVPGDYDGNGATDIAVFRPSTGTWFNHSTGTATSWGQSGDVPVPGDYDGNGTIDLAVFRPASGTWFVWAGTSVQAFLWGVSSDAPTILPAAIESAFFAS